MKTLLHCAALACLLLAASVAARPVDDSYTIASRFERYRSLYPGIAWPAVAPAPGETMLFDRAYKTLPDRDLHLDIFRPAPDHTRHQGLVLVHGGAWRSGSKAHFYVLADRLAQRGYTVFLPEIRLSPEAPFPAGLVDVSDTMVWVKTHAAEFGLSPQKIALGGASSGGQMAALVAYSDAAGLFRSTPQDDRSANALIDIDGVLDFTTPLALQFENANGTQSSAAKWLGGSWDQVPQRWKEASAATYVGAKSPPTLIISSGNAHFTEGKDQVMASLQANHIPARWYAFEKAPHDIWLFEPWLPTVVDTIDNFLKSLHE
ncbi:alpha/beta hydrolase [Novosphingobium terrae]|uniref:alpha/beta hydrolase n=1 Tax=Novosphingobium terrae TaxID=2726189 RepID=UPI001981D3B8|nr:alpha/beta hydrolase [Novosphingobium terrae]